MINKELIDKIVDLSNAIYRKQKASKHCYLVFTKEEKEKITKNLLTLWRS